MASYNRRILGYRNKRNESRVCYTKEVRLSILYDHFVHKKSVRDLIHDYGINYSSIKHILLQYIKYGKTDVRKQRPSYYVPLD